MDDLERYKKALKEWLHGLNQEYDFTGLASANTIEHYLLDIGKNANTRRQI